MSGLTNGVTRPIEAIRVGERHRKAMGDIAELAASIATIGLLHPIAITPDDTLIAGERRLRAAQALGWRDIPVHVVPLAEIVRGELHENTKRKPFTPSEWVAIERVLKPAEQEAARERQEELGRHQGADPSGNFPEGSKGRARDKVAEFVGVSGKTLEHASAVVAAAEREPEQFADLQAEMDRTGRVNGVYRKLHVREEASRIEAEPPPLPTGPFRVLVADPPWPYEKRAGDPSHRTGLPYASMTMDDIRALPVTGLAAEDAILWLWTTNAHLREAFTVLDAWGFEHKTMLTWVKDRMGTGDWLRGQTEHCLLAVRGRPTIVLTNQTTVLEAPMKAHSEKPAAFYEMVETLCPGSKVDLFARRTRVGWVSWGGGVGAS